LVLKFLTGDIQGDIENRDSFKEGLLLRRDSEDAEEIPNALQPPDCSHFLLVTGATEIDEWLLLRTQIATCGEAIILVWNQTLTTIVE
jgi:hypothetical protein